MAERGELTLLARERCKTTLATPGHLFEEDALDRRSGAEAQDLLGRRLDHTGTHGRTLFRGRDERRAESII